jgi:N-methylhydantoinase B
LNGLEPDIPRNAGSFRRIRILIREGCLVGKPKFPASCSLATTNIADRLINLIQGLFATLGEGFGLAHGGTGMSAVVSGTDFRHQGGAFINQVSLNVNGGPGGPVADGWVTYGIPAGGGMIYRESIELTELKQPIMVEQQRLRPCSGGAGRRRGSPGADVIYGPRRDPITLSVASDSQQFPAAGVRGGLPGAAGAHIKISANGAAEQIPTVAVFAVRPGEKIRFLNAAGGGYGDPLAREPDRVLADVRRGWETIESAGTTYGVVLTGSVAAETLAVDATATAAARSAMRKAAE